MRGIQLCLLNLVIFCLAGAILAACSNGAAGRALAPERRLAAPGQGLPALSDLPAGPSLRGTSANPPQVLGNEYALASTDAAVKDPQLVLKPSGSGLSYALYRFSAEDSQQLSQVVCHLSGTNYPQLWIAVSDFANQRWQWFGQFTDSETTLNLDAPAGTYSRDGSTWVAIVCGQGALTLSIYSVGLRFNDAAFPGWVTRIGETGRSYGTSANATDSSGNLFHAGGRDNWPTPDMMIFKMSAAGGLLKAKTYVLPGSVDIESPYPGIREMTMAQNGDLLAAGYVHDPQGTDHLLLLRLTPDLQLVWQKDISMGNDIEVRDIFPLPDGGAILVGNDNSEDIDFGWLMRVDAAGAVQWCHRIENNLLYASIFAAARDLSSGDICMVGGATQGAGSGYYLLSTDQNGDALWGRTWQLGSGMEAWTVQPDGDGSWLVGADDALGGRSLGSPEGDLILMRINALGTLISQNFFSVPDKSVSVIAGAAKRLPNGDFAFLGTWTALFGTHKNFILRLSPELEPLGYLSTGLDLDNFVLGAQGMYFAASVDDAGYNSGYRDFGIFNGLLGSTAELVANAPLQEVELTVSDLGALSSNPGGVLSDAQCEVDPKVGPELQMQFVHLDSANL